MKRVRFSFFSLFFVALFFLSACSSQTTPTAQITKVDSFPEDVASSESEETSEETATISPTPEGVFCESFKTGVRGRDANDQLYEYKNSCIKNIWYHQYQCVNDVAQGTNIKCEAGCNLFGCDEI